MKKKEEFEKIYRRFLSTLDKNLVNNKTEIISTLNRMEEILLEIVKKENFNK